MAKDSERLDDRSGIGRELRRGSLELVVLHVLAPAEAYGYEIVTMLASRTDGVLAVTDGTLYPILYRLERAGLVTKHRVGRRKVVRTNVTALLMARRLLDQYEELWRERIERMIALVAEEPEEETP